MPAGTACPPGRHCFPGMPNINGVLARVFVPDLDAAIPLYQALAQAPAVNRFRFRDAELP